jgi:putative endonuclease
MDSGFVYVLRCGDGKYYYGCTNDLIQRLGKHRRGLVKSAKWRLPVNLTYFEEHTTLDQARQRERAFKRHGLRRKALERLIAEFSPDRLAPFA